MGRKPVDRPSMVIRMLVLAGLSPPILLGPVVKMAGGTSCPHKAFGELPGSPHRSGDSSLHGEHGAPDEADPESAGGGTS